MDNQAFIGADGNDWIDHWAQLDGSIAWDGGPSHWHADSYSGAELAHYKQCYAQYMQTKAVCAGL